MKVGIKKVHLHTIGGALELIKSIPQGHSYQDDKQVTHTLTEKEVAKIKKIMEEELENREKIAHSNGELEKFQEEKAVDVAKYPDFYLSENLKKDPEAIEARKQRATVLIKNLQKEMTSDGLKAQGEKKSLSSLGNSMSRKKSPRIQNPLKGRKNPRSRAKMLHSKGSKGRTHSRIVRKNPRAFVLDQKA